eukprot:TRINITY_DN3923_c0_g1_i1.p1 TRINITY_DN3923_c0_g1~~TRINITY_DN3923_c0_g1_i1.p1  ORF type:complete len:262 (+),score=52.06 TRINITY_DN3923_c0_g1_i1:36-821(+)
MSSSSSASTSSKSTGETLDALFTRFASHLEAEGKKREDIGKEVRELNRIVRNTQFLLGRVQTAINDQKEMSSITLSALDSLKECTTPWTNIAKLIGSDQPEKYHDHWRFTVQSLVFLAAYASWLKDKTLITQTQCAQVVGMGQTPITIDIQDYLEGIVTLPKEMSRLCMNAVRSQNYTIPNAISTFVSDLYNGFRLLNLRNDNLRRKFDGIKYDIQKIEEVLYDVQIRKLTTSPTSNSSLSSSSSASSSSSSPSISKSVSS